MDYQRKCDNWLQTFLSWTLPLSQAPESCLFFTGLFTLSSAIRRHVYISKRTLGKWECYPHLYMVLHGKAGVINKSTTLSMGEELLLDLPMLNRSPDMVTVPELLNRLSKTNDGSIYIASKELGDIIAKAGPDMYGFLISLFDGVKKFDESTISREYVFTENPCVNFAACTTPEWTRDNMTAGILNGGWGSRTIFIHEDAPRQRRLIYDRLNDEDLKGIDFDKMRENLVADLEYIAEEIRGEVTFDTYKTAKWFDSWFREDCIAKGEYVKISGYYNRKPAHVMKIAMLMKVAYTEELVLDQDDLEQAIKVLDRIEPNMLKVFGNIGRNTYVADIDSIHQYIKEKIRVPRSLLLRAFRNSAEPVMLESLLENMRAMELIDMVNDKDAGEFVYIAK